MPLPTVKKNVEVILESIREMEEKGAKVMVLPELCITGYTCADLFWQGRLLEEAKESLQKIANETADVDALIFVGLPLEVYGKLYNVAAVLNRGELLGIVPKKYLPNYNEFYEARHFTPGEETAEEMTLFGPDSSFWNEPAVFLRGYATSDRGGGESVRYLWAPEPPSVRHALAGATVIVNLSASDEMVGKDSYRRNLVATQSARLVCGYLYSTAGEGESSQDLVFGGQNLIAENGVMLAEARRFHNETVCTELDVDRLVSERRRMTTYPAQKDSGYRRISFSLRMEDTVLTRFVNPHPFVPSDKRNRELRCDEILNIQAMGLKKRLEHTHCRSAVIGISGGLDSTLALLVTVRAFDMLGLPREQILSVTMPCFGTTDRTYQNACQLTRCLGATLKEVDIKEAVTIHFRDIGQDMENHDVTYENGQARERTQILMDLANQTGGMVIGTG